MASFGRGRARAAAGAVGLAALGVVVAAAVERRERAGDCGPLADAATRHAIVEGAWDLFDAAPDERSGRAAALEHLRSRGDAVRAAFDAGDDGLAIEWRGGATPLFLGLESGTDLEAAPVAARAVPRGVLSRRGVWGGLADALFPARSVAARTPGNNRTPGNGGPGNTLAVVWSPYRWAGDAGELEFRTHACEGTLSGQRYDDSLAFVEAEEPTADAPAPVACTLSAFESLLGEFGFAQLGILFVTTTSGRNGSSLAVENYHRSPNGIEAIEAAYENYVERTDYGGDELRLGATRLGYHIAVRPAFLTARYRAGKAMVFVNGCVAPELLEAFVRPEDGALVAIAHADCPTRRESKERVRLFFSRLDGKEGQESRPVDQAIAGLPLVATGYSATTLAPSVLWHETPCPMMAGRVLRITFDTACDTNVFPEVVSNELEFGQVRWRNEFTLEAICTQPPRPVRRWEARILWPTVKGGANGSRLDGNLIPSGSNAEGPAHDDFVFSAECITGGLPDR